MGLAHSSKSEGLVQEYRVQKHDGKMRLKIQKMRFKCGFGFGPEKEAMRRTQWANFELHTPKMR